MSGRGAERPKRIIAGPLMGLLAMLLAGCVRGGGELVGLLTAGPDAQAVAASPIEVYRRVAGGMQRCWLGPDGPLAARYVFFAEAVSNGGGRARIALHEKARDGKRGLKAFEVVMVPRGEETLVTVANLRFAGAQGDAMAARTRAWAAGATECGAL